MKSLLFSLLIISSASVFSQDDFTEVDAKRVVDTFFEGFHKGDTIMMRSMMAPGMIMQTAYATPTGDHKVHDSDATEFLKVIAERPEAANWDERLLDYQVQIDGNLSHVWTPYEFYVNDTFSHCGANAFTLVRTNDGWKIQHLIDSRRKGSCKE